MNKRTEDRFWTSLNAEYSEKLHAISTECGLSPSKFIKKTVIDVIDGITIPRVIVQQQAINLMEEVQKLNQEYPDISTDGFERIGDKLCRISL